MISSKEKARHAGLFFGQRTAALSLAAEGVEVAQEDRLEGGDGVFAGDSENTLGGEDGGEERRAVSGQFIAVAVAEPDGRGGGGVVVLDTGPDQPLPVLRVVGCRLPGGDPAGATDFAVDSRTAEKWAGEQHPVDIAGMAALVQ